MPGNEFFDGLFLMVVGMGTVFLFLILLILATEMIRIVAGSPAAPPAAPPGAQGGGDDPVTIAVITSAINRFRKEQGN